MTRSCQVLSNMWCPLLEAVYHHSIGGYLAMSHSSKAVLSQSCHFALFVKLVARSSTDGSSRCATGTLSTNAVRRQHACSAGMSSWPCRRSTRCPCGRSRVFRAPRWRRATAHTAGGAMCSARGHQRALHMSLLAKCRPE